MQHDDPLARSRKIKQRFAIHRRVEKLPVHADHRHIRIRKLRRSLVTVLRVMHRKPCRLQRRHIRLAKELREVVR